MNKLPALVAASVLAVSSFGLLQTAAFASSTSTRDGGYVEAQRHVTTVVEFVVGDHGTRVTEGDITCDPSASLVAQSATVGSEQLVPIPEPLPGRISPGGTTT
jgi:hypothetical protein